MYRITLATFLITFGLAHSAWGKPAIAPAIAIEQEQTFSCGSPPPPTSTWFYLGQPGPRVAPTSAKAAQRVYHAIMDAFDHVVIKDPACLHVEVLDADAMRARSRSLDGHRSMGNNVVGFHQTKLGADNTVYVMPKPGQGLEIVMLHEVLHALSHRFSMETSRHRTSVLTEGATEYLTRELASVSLGIPKPKFLTGYGPYLKLYTVLIDALGADGLALLGEAYLIEGYDYFEKEVDRRLGISLREAGRLLQAGDLRAALQQIHAR